MPALAHRAIEKTSGITVWRRAVAPELVFYRGIGVSHPYPRHWHDELHVCGYTSGSGYLACRGSSRLVGEGDFVVTPPGEVHENWVPNGSSVSFVSVYIPVSWLRAAVCDLTENEQPWPDFPDMFPRKEELVQSFFTTYQALEAGAPHLHCEELLRDLLRFLVLSNSTTPSYSDRKTHESYAVRQARDYIDEHFADSISLAQLGVAANLSPFHFHRQFCLQAGMPPHAYQTQVRINRAKDLLRDRRPLCEIAASTGFADQSHLTRHFRRIVGVTPGHYSAIFNKDR